MNILKIMHPPFGNNKSEVLPFSVIIKSEIPPFFLTSPYWLIMYFALRHA